jgi:hypothetical protein
MATRRTTESPRSTQPHKAEQPAEKRPARKRATRASAPAPAAAAIDAEVEISPDARRGMIAEAAYLRAQARGFVPGYELEDWIAAEGEVDSLLAAEHSRRPQ